MGNITAEVLVGNHSALALYLGILGMTLPHQQNWQWRDLVRGLLILYFGTLLWQTPEAYRDIQERAQLEHTGTETTGKVVSLHPPTRRNKCKSTALIQYQVGQVPYQVVAEGCGAAADGGLHIGAEARVIYLQQSPSVAQARASGVHTKRASWSTLAAAWGGFLMAAAVAWMWSSTRHPKNAA